MRLRKHFTEYSTFLSHKYHFEQQEKTIGKTWTESMIRNEIKGLDAITGLDGTSLKIAFTRSSVEFKSFGATKLALKWIDENC